MGENLNPFGPPCKSCPPARGAAPRKARSPAVFAAGLLKVSRNILLRRSGRGRIALLAALLGLLVVFLLMAGLGVLRVRAGRRGSGRGRGRGRGRLGEGRAGDQGERDDGNELLEHRFGLQSVSAQQAPRRAYYH